MFISKNIAKQIKNRWIKNADIEYGIRRFIKGFVKKVVFANEIGSIANVFITHNLVNDSSIFIYWLVALCFTLQIYFDFSGYSDMAIGIGRMLGFKIPENFKHPYTARGMRDFWRKWHISLSEWFRDYLYIPLGGNRISSKRTYFNLLLVFLLTGLWHGSNWIFVIWGLYHGIFLLLERKFKFINKLPNFLVAIYMFIVILISWVLFFSPNLDFFKKFLLGMIGNNGHNTILLFSIDSYKYFIILLGIIVSFPIIKPAVSILESKSIGLLISRSIFLLIFIFAISQMAISTFNPFIYFRF